MIFLLVFPLSGAESLRFKGVKQGVVSAVPPADLAPLPRPAQPPRPVPRVRWVYPRGVVTEVTTSSITIQGFSYTLSGVECRSPSLTPGINYLSGNPLTLTINGNSIQGTSILTSTETLAITGLDGQVTTFCRVDQPLQRYKACPALAAGGVLSSLKNRSLSSCDSYRLSDVRVGDVVDLCCLSGGRGIAECQTIGIRRRPGGRVPPALGEPANRLEKFHEIMQAAQDLEEKAAARLPDPFLSKGCAERRAKIAPMPREVILRIPTKMP